MIDTDLYIALGGDESKKRLRKAQKRYLKTLSYDDGTIVKNKSDRYYDLGGILNAAGPMAKSILSDSLDTTYDKIKAQKEYNNRSVLSGVSDNNSLLDMFGNLQWADDNYTNKDFRKASLFDDISGVIMGAGSGATASGSWIGAAVGAGLVGGKKLFDVFKAKKEKDKANADASNFNAGLSNMIGQVADNVDTLNDRLLMQNYFNQAAFGGSLGTHGSDFSNGLVQINAGGTHESNPNEGVPAGIAPDGTPNLVEEGEVIWNNDYVFSNRIKIPAKLRNKYKLGGGLSFAEAIKEVTKESEDRKNDPISNATTRKIVEEFIDAQEEIRNERQQRALSELQQAQAESDFINALSQVSPIGASNPIQLQTPVAPETNEPPVIEGMAYGGRFDIGGPKRRGLDPLLTKQFPEDPSPLEYLIYKLDAEYDPTMPEVYPYNFKTRVQAKRAYNTEQNRLRTLEAKKRIQNSKLYKWVDNIDNKYLGDTLLETPKEYHIDSLFSNDGNLFMDGGHKFDDGGNLQRVLDSLDYSGLTAYEANELRKEYTKIYERARASALRRYKEDSPRYNEEVRSALASIRDTHSNSRKQREEQRTAFNAERQESLRQEQLKRNAAEWRTNQGYRANALLTDADRQIYNDILAGKRDAQGNLISAQTEGTTDNTPDLPDVEEQTAQAQQEQIEGTGSAQEPTQKTESTDDGRQTPPTPPAQGFAQLPTIPYNRGINGADFEAQQYYQDFLNYIQDPKNSGEVNDWINKINNDIAASGSSYKVKNLNDLIRLATDQKVGPVHQAFNRIANELGNANASRPFNISEDENNYNSLVDKLEALGVDTSNIPMYGYDQNGNPIGTTREGFGLPRVDNELNRAFDRFNQTISRGRAMQGWLPSIDNGLEDALAEYNSSIIGRKSGRQTLDNPYLPQPPVEETTEESGNTPNGNTGNTGNTDWMRKAPIFGSALGVATGLLGNPDYSNADAILEASERMGVPVSIPVETIGDYVQRRPFDERYLVNMANQNRAAASRSMRNTAGGNRAMQLGADAVLAHNNQQELGEIMRQAYLANRQDMFNTAEFNRGTNLQNMSAINQRNLSQAQLNSNRQQAALSGLMTGRQMRQGIRNAWDAATSQNLSNLFTNIGLLGRESVTDNMIRSMVENGFGNLMMNKDGTMTFIPTTKESNGGKLKKKRRF